MSDSPVVAFGQSAVIEKNHPIFISEVAWNYISSKNGRWQATNGLTICTGENDRYNAEKKEWHISSKQTRNAIFTLDKQCPDAPYDLIKEALIQLVDVIQHVSALSGFEMYPKTAAGAPNGAIVAFGPITETPKIETTVYISKAAWNFVRPNWTSRNGIQFVMNASSLWEFSVRTDRVVCYVDSNCVDKPVVLENLQYVDGHSFAQSGVTFARLSEALTELGTAVKGKTDNVDLTNLTCI